MNDRLLTLFRVLMVFSMVASVARAQAPPRRPSVSERISAIGRTLTGTQEDSQQATQAAATNQADQRTAFPQVDGQSLLPTNRFGSRTAQPTTQNAQRQARGNTQPQSAADPQAAQLGQPARQPAPRPAATLHSTTIPNPRTAIRPNEGTAEAESLQDRYQLPGLGGSPLPSGIAGATVSDSNLASQDQTARAAASGAASAPSFPTAASAGSAVRNSPQRRTPTYVNPSELRHDLAGAYPDAKATTQAAEAVPQETPELIGTPRPVQGSENIFTLPSAAEPSAQPNTPVVESGPTTVVPQLDAAQSTTIAPSTANASSAAHTPSTTKKQTSDSTFGPGTSSQGSVYSQSGTSSQGSTLTGPTTTAVPSQPASPTASSGRSGFGEAGAARSNMVNILVSNQAPIISTDIRGPKQIVVGREALFHVRVHNQGNAAAEGIELTVRIPSWANVVDTTSSTGSVAQSPTMDAAGTLKWQLPRLAAGTSESLDLKLVPRSSRPLELGVNWTVSPVGSRAIVEVQEPKLEMNVSGPDEVLFGKPQLYRFTLTNPGTGTAENVKIELYPPGGGEKAAASNAVGNLAPGKSQTIEVELVARDSGKLQIKAVAMAEGDLTSEAIKEVFCRKPELTIDWRGPEMKYAGTEATYHVRVRNPGTAPAEDVTVRATLPDGAMLSSASEGQVYDAARREIAWRVGSLGPGDDYFMELKCTVTNPGKNQVRLAAATAAGDLTDTKLAETNVVALADLKLEVSDPSGPVAVGADAIYEIRVQNRGASAAREINVVGLFSAGVEPVGVDGAQYSVTDGRVSFRAIDELPAGRQITLRIRAHALQPGTHVFRAEVLCRDLEIKLAAEETTRFFADDASAGEAGNKQADLSNAFDSPAR